MIEEHTYRIHLLSDDSVVGFVNAHDPYTAKKEWAKDNAPHDLKAYRAVRLKQWEVCGSWFTIRAAFVDVLAETAEEAIDIARCWEAGEDHPNQALDEDFGWISNNRELDNSDGPTTYDVWENGKCLACRPASDQLLLDAGPLLRQLHKELSVNPGVISDETFTSLDDLIKAINKRCGYE